MSNRLRRASFILVGVGIAATTAWYFAIRLPPIPRRPLRIGFEQNLPVQIRTPSGFAGLAVEAVNEAAKRARVELQWVETGTSSDEAFRKGLVDLWPLMANLPERRNRVHITRPWLHSRLVLVVREGAGFPDRRFTGRIALFKIPLHYRLLREEFPEAQLVQVPEALEVMKEVCRGTAVGFLDQHMPNVLKEKLPECASVPLRVRTDPGMTLEFGVASTFEAARAAEMIRREIGNMFRDGTLASSMAKYSYFGVDDAWATYDLMESAERARWMTWGVTAALIALSLTLWQTFSLRQRKRAEAVLRESEERFRAIFSQAAVGIALTSPDSRWLLVNNRFCEILGYSQDELRGKTFLDLTHPDDRETTLGAAPQLLAGEIPSWSTEKRYIRKDGSTVWARLFTSAVLGKDNQPQYSIAVVEDITAKVQAERALRDSEQRLSLAQSAARLGVWDRDLRTDVITIGGEYTKLYGLPAGQPSLTREEWMRLVHPDDRERVGALMQESLEKTHVWDAEFRVLWPDGAVHWILGKGAVHFDDSDRAIHVVGVNLDITERKQAEAALRESEERFRSLADTAPVMIWVSDTDRLCTFLNKPWLDFTGRTMEQELGNGWAAGVHPEDLDRYLATLTSSFDARRSFQMEYRLRRADGEYRWVLGNAIPLYRGGEFTGYIGSCVDVTGQKMVEERLRASEARLTDAQRLAKVGSWERNVNTDTIQWSDEMRRIFGPPDAPPDFQTFLSYIHPKDLEKILGIHEKLFSDSTTPVDVEYRIIRRDGEMVFVRSMVEAIQNDHGELVRIVGATQDITEQVKARELLRESEERLKHAERLAHVGNWQWDIKANRVTWSEEMFRVFGKPQDYTPGYEGFLQAIIPEDRERMERRVRDTLAGKIGHSIEYRIARPDGDLRTIAAMAEVLQYEDGLPVRIIGACQDVTESKQAEAKLRESEERFRRIADTAPVMIGVSGPDKLASFFNRAWLDFRGRTMEQELGYGWTEGLHPDDRDAALATYSWLFGAPGHIKCECRVRRADGEYRWLLCSAVARFEPGGDFAGIIGSAIDITDIKRTQEETTAKQKLESVGTLANGIAHDFNNLLGGVLAQAEVALDELASGSPPEEELKAIREVAIRGSEIVRQLMIYAGKESGVLGLVDVSRTIEQMLALLKVSVSKRAALEIDLGKDLPAVLANAAQLRQIVLNLVTNASEAIGDRDGVIRVTTRAEGDYLQLEVSDTGGGMPPETQARVFDPFFTTKSTGHGLGLAVVDGIVRSLRGAIHLESEPGKGSTFQILLPCGGTAAEAPNGRISDAGEAARPPQEATVLVVEDESPLRQAVVKMLLKTGFSVMEASDGSAALEVIQSHRSPIDVLFLDITLPGTTSRKVFEEAKRLRPEMRVIITSAYTEDLAAVSLQGRIERFIRKPYRFSDLMEVVRQSLS